MFHLFKYSLISTLILRLGDGPSQTGGSSSSMADLYQAAMERIRILEEQAKTMQASAATPPEGLKRSLQFSQVSW